MDCSKFRLRVCTYRSISRALPVRADRAEKGRAEVPRADGLRGQRIFRKFNAFFENAISKNAFFENFANFWRARSRLYRSRFLQENNGCERMIGLLSSAEVCGQVPFRGAVAAPADGRVLRDRGRSRRCSAAATWTTRRSVCD